jgi:MFS family permease
MMGYKQAIARNPRLLFWGKVFTEAKALAVVGTLFLMHRDLAIDEIYYLSIVWSLVTLITEVPSGYLADCIGRKRTIMIGMALYLAACIIRIYAHGFIQFSIIFVLFSVGFSCISGAEEALLFDSLKEMRKQDEMQQLNARLRAGKFVARLAIALMAILLVKELKEAQYLILVKIDIAMIVIAFIIISMVKEPALKSKSLGKNKDFFLKSLTTIKKHPWLARATLSKLLLFFAGFFLFRAYQPFLKINGATVLIIVCFFLVSRGGLFVIHWYSGSLVKLIGTARLINGSAILTVVCLVLTLVFKNNIWLMVAPFTIASIMVDVREPLFAKAINQRIDSENRATTLSVLNMVKAVLDIPLLLLIGILAKINLDNAIIGAIVLCLVALIFFRSKEKEFEDIKLS